MITNEEKEFLILLFQIGKVIIENAGGAYELNDTFNTFSRNDLFDLACKLNIKNNI